MPMETIHVETVADRQPPLTTTEVVSNVISQNSSNATFFKNAIMATPSIKTPSAGGQVLCQ